VKKDFDLVEIPEKNQQLKVIVLILQLSYSPDKVMN